MTAMTKNKNKTHDKIGYLFVCICAMSLSIFFALMG